MYYLKIALSTVSYLYICRVLSIGELSQKTASDPHHEVVVEAFQSCLHIGHFMSPPHNSSNYIIWLFVPTRWSMLY